MGKKVIIIPSDLDNRKVFSKRIGYGKYHIECYQEYDMINSLNCNFNKWDHHIAPMTISNLGDLVIEIDELFKSIIFYIPRVITDKQLIYVSEHYKYFNKRFEFIGGFYYSDDSEVRLNSLGRILNKILENNRKQIERVKKYVR